MGLESGIGGGPTGRWYRVQAISSHSLGGTAGSDYASVLPAILTAARHRRPFIAGWLSRGGSAPLELITNAGLAAAAGQAAAVTPPSVDLLFPWGARGEVIDRNILADLDQLVWAPCPGRPVPPSAEAGGATPGAADPGQPTLFEMALATLVGRPFGWLVVADPTDQLDTEVGDLREQLSVLRRYEDERGRLEADRAERRLAELESYREAGLWHVRVLAGAANEEDLRLIAPVLVGSADLRAHPYRLRCPGGAQEFADALAAKVADPADGSMVPFAATAGALAALTGLPRRELPGVRILTPGCFDMTATPVSGAALELGDLLDGQDRPVGSMRIPLAALSRHALVTGAAGSGKSVTIRHLLAQLTAADISWLVVEAAKSEYLAATTINPVDPESTPLSVNPLAPEPGYPVQAHIDMVRALFVAAYDAPEPFAEIMSRALQRSYTECGWDPLTGAGRADTDVLPAVPTLARIQAAALAEIDDGGHQPAVRGVVDGLLTSLRTGPAGRLAEGGHPADIGKLLQRDVVLGLGGMADDQDKAFVIGGLIIRLVEHLRLRATADPPVTGQPSMGQSGGPRHVLVLEDARRLLRADRAGAAARAVELFAGLLAEVGAYGEGVVMAEQAPAKLAPEVIKNTAIKILHRLPAADDRLLVGATMNLDADQSRHVVSLPPGQAAVFADGMATPVRIRVPADVAGSRAAQADGLPLPLAGRRSAACGPACTGERPCTVVEIRAADLVARSPLDAWLRVWTEVYVLAQLTNQPRPRVPVPLRQRWASQGKRLRECALATTLDASVLGRGTALRESYDPASLAAACATSAAAMLDGGKGAGTRPGTTWVIPQLRWLHELERVCPNDGPPPDPFAPAPALDYTLPDLADRADVKVGQRITALRRHSLSMEVPRNRLMAWCALLGEDDQSAFIEDLAAVAIGVSHRGQLRKAAGEMGVTGWLEAVLSWPRRFIVGADDQVAILSAPEAAPVAG